MYFYCISDSVFFIPGRKNPILVLNGYEFNLEHKAIDKSFWACKLKNKDKCKSRIQTHGKTVTVTHLEHNHSPTYDPLKKGSTVTRLNDVCVKYC